MKDWFKRFGLSMFSDKYAAESTMYGAGNILLTSLLAAVLLIVGIFAGKYALFGADYGNAAEFRSFAYHAFEEGNIAIDVERIGNADITVGGENRVINTYTSADDKARYARNGYELIVDPNNVASTYDDFDAYWQNKSDGTRIDGAMYYTLSAQDKKAYKFCVDYTGTPKTISAEDADEYLEYLKTVDAAKDELDEVITAGGSVPVGEYRDSLFALYVKHYYPEMNDVAGEAVPTLRGYYYTLVGSTSEKYLCMFGDMTTAAFVTGAGKAVKFGLAYTDVGVSVNATQSESARREAVDGLFKDGYYSGVSALLFADFMGIMLVLMFVVLIILLTIASSWLVCRKLNIALAKTFADSAKLVCSYSHIAALFGAITGLLFGFLLTGTGVTAIGLCVFFAAMAVRTAILLVREYKKEKREEESEGSDAQDGEPDTAR